eukprot:8232738-Pyramimonas_sp.AAC.1
MSAHANGQPHGTLLAQVGREAIVEIIVASAVQFHVAAYARRRTHQALPLTQLPFTARALWHAAQ